MIAGRCICLLLSPMYEPQCLYLCLFPRSGIPEHVLHTWVSGAARPVTHARTHSHTYHGIDKLSACVIDLYGYLQQVAFVFWWWWWRDGGVEEDEKRIESKIKKEERKLREHIKYKEIRE